MEKKKLPYGIPNFNKIIEEDYLFIDKTPFVEKMENLNEPYIFFLRPRKFGKSLFVSLLEYYYGIEHSDDFDRLFGDFYIGEKPTPLHNSYLVLTFDFSGINTETKESTYIGFGIKVHEGVGKFLDRYENCLDIRDKEKILAIEEPEGMVVELLRLVRAKTDKKIYLLIDEYDHFANELLAFRIETFQELVSRAGFVRKFYEVLKTGARDGIIDRMFITGVTPITLDSFTSGFNIGRNLSLDEQFHDMLGFTEDEIRSLIQTVCSSCSTSLEEIYQQMSAYYNGHKFCDEYVHFADCFVPRNRLRLTVYGKLFNPTMVLYYLNDYQRYCRPPRRLIDSNIASDYRKIGNFFRLFEIEEGREIINDLMARDIVYGNLTVQFNLERKFGRDDFISLLLYMGFISVERMAGESVEFSIPNYVIKERYYEYLYEIMEQEYGLELKVEELRSAMRELAYQGKIESLVIIIEEFLKKVLSNRDFRGFKESHYSWEGAWGRVGERSNTNNMERLNRPEKPPPKPSPNILKVHILTLLHLSKMYYIQSELEAERGYIDIFLREAPQFPVDYEWVLELKYVQKSEGIEQVKDEGMGQLKKYMQKVSPQARRHLKGALLIFGSEGVCLDYTTD